MKSLYIIIPIILVLQAAPTDTTAPILQDGISNAQNGVSTCGAHIMHISDAYLRPYQGEFDAACTAFKKCSDFAAPCASAFIESLTNTCDSFHFFLKQEACKKLVNIIRGAVRKFGTTLI